MLNERKLTERELDKRAEAIQGLLKNKRTLVKKYGKDAEKVMYGIATKQAKKKIEKMNLNKLKELIQQTLEGKDDKKPLSKPLPKPVAKDLGKMKTNFNDLKKRLKLEGHGLDQGDIDVLQNFVDRAEVKDRKIKKVLQFIIKSNILQDKTKDLSKGKVEEANNLLKQDALSSAEYQKAKKLKGFDPKNYKWDKNQELHLIRKMNESLNPEVSNAVNRFIKAMAKRYSYSEKDAVFAIQAALKQRKFDSLDERVAKIDEILDEGVVKDMHVFLDALRDSGVTNMFGAAPYLQKEFGLEKGEARQVLANWMQSFSENLDEIDMNDPVLMRMRASKPEPSRGGIDYDEALSLRIMRRELMDQVDQLFIDMEQEAEPEGGPIADRYAEEAQALEDRIFSISRQLSDYDMNESTRQDLGMVSSISKSRAKSHLKNPSNDGSKVYGLDSDGKRVELKGLNDVDKFKKFEIDADLKEGVNEVMDGGTLFDYFNKEYVVGDHFHSDDSYIVKREPSGKDQYVIFDYDKDKDQFQIRQMGGYRIDQKDAIKAGMRETGITRVAGIDSYMVDGNYSPTPISAEGLKDIVDHVMGGLSREAKAQRDFYGARGRTSGTIDEKISSIVKEKLTRSQIHKRAKKGSYPAFLVAIENGKVIAQEKVETPQIAPAAYNVMSKKYPNANIRLEDSTGKILEKLTKSSSVEDHIEDFKDSDAPQFKGKSLKKIKQMALASFLQKQGKKKVAEGFKVGQKVTYLGHPAEITKADKDVMDRVYYNVLYDKGTGKTKASNIYNKDGEIKASK